MNELDIRPLVLEEEYGVCVAVDAFVDGSPLDGSDRFAISLHALRDSTRSSGEHYILTCGCGDPGCAGLEEGILVAHNDELVEWHITEPLPERWFVFEASAYKTAVEAGIARAQETFAEVRRRTPASKSVEAGPYGEEDIYRAG